MADSFHRRGGRLRISRSLAFGGFFFARLALGEGSAPAQAPEEPTSAPQPSSSAPAPGESETTSPAEENEAPDRASSTPDDAAVSPSDATSTSSSSLPEDESPSSAEASSGGETSASDEGVSSEEGELQRDAPEAEEPIDPPRPSREEDGEFPPVFEFAKKAEDRSRWIAAGGFFGVANRSATSRGFQYKPGIARGVYLRPEIRSWLSARVFIRVEDVPVEVEPGAFDTESDAFDFDFHQSNLNAFSMGIRLEPRYRFNEYFSVEGIVHWAWYRFEAKLPRAAGFSMKADRSGSELDWSLGLGVTAELIPSWLELNVSATYGIVSAQTGSAYDTVQVVVDGELAQLAALPKLGAPLDVLLQLGLIL